MSSTLTALMCALLYFKYLSDLSETPKYDFKKCLKKFLRQDSDKARARGTTRVTYRFSSSIHCLQLEGRSLSSTIPHIKKIMQYKILKQCKCRKQ